MRPSCGTDTILSGIKNGGGRLVGGCHKYIHVLDKEMSQRLNEEDVKEVERKV